MAFNKEDKIGFWNGPMEFVGTVMKVEKDSGTIKVSGVETGCGALEPHLATLPLWPDRPALLRVLSDEEFAERTRHEPAFGSTAGACGPGA